ncbi:MAG: magnesium transporter [Litorimonas sp.]
MERPDNTYISVDERGVAVNVITHALTLKDDAALRLALKALHPADFSDQLEQLTAEQRAGLIARAPELISGDVLTELEDEVVEDILPLLGAAKLAETITELDHNDATQIIEEMDEAQRADVLGALPRADRAALEEALTFDDETIGRLMQREFVAAPEFWSVGDTIDHMRETGGELPEVFFNIYVIDAAFKPIGYVPLSSIMRTPRDVQITTLMSDELVIITQDQDQEDAAYLFEKYNLISAPVVNTQGRLVGTMSVDDIIEIIQDENKEDMLALAGVSDAGLTDTAFSTVRSRAPWLCVNLLTAILASFVIAQFDYAISQFVALAVLMPIVASMGGNAGTQALAVAVRALAERDLTSQTAWRAVRRETLAAAMIGVIFASALALIAYLWFGDIKLAMAAFIAMIINHIFAGLAGISIPLILKRAGFDPAVASSVFVTTVTDIIGFFAFLGFAVLILF